MEKMESRKFCVVTVCNDDNISPIKNLAKKVRNITKKLIKVAFSDDNVTDKIDNVKNYRDILVSKDKIRVF
jgi:hypothetical protein